MLAGRRRLYSVLISSLAFVFELSAGDGVSDFQNEKEKVSYAVGLIFGHGLRKDDFEIDADMLLRGLRDSYAGSNSVRFSGADARRIIDEHRTLLANKAREK